MSNEDYTQALSDEIPAGYHDHCSPEKLFDILVSPDAELDRLNKHRKSDLTVTELRKLVIKAIEMIYDWLVIIWNPHEAIDALLDILPTVMTASILAGTIANIAKEKGETNGRLLEEVSSQIGNGQG